MHFDIHFNEVPEKGLQSAIDFNYRTLSWSLHQAKII